jgi:hypothetical protein
MDTAPESMPSELQTQFSELWQEVAGVHMKWKSFLDLYAEQATIRLLNDTAPAFFRIFQDVLLDDVIMSICRLTDPPRSGGNSNLTLRRLLDSIDSSVYPELKKTATDRYLTLDGKVGFARSHRNKRIAHSDLERRLRMPATPLAPITQQQVQSVLDSIASFMNTIEGFFSRSETVYSYPIVKDDAETLLYWLRKGYETRMRRGD